MVNHFRKLFIVLISFSLILTSCSSESENTKYVNKSNNEIKVHFINVGQGDSILIKVNGYTLMIDSGPKESNSTLLKYLKSNNITTIDYLIATHPHEDHIGGMSSILNSFKVKSFYAPKVTSNTSTYSDMIKSLKSNNLKINVVKSGVELDLGGNCKGSFLSPIDAEYDDLNNYSAVLRIQYGSTSFLFTGDAEKKVESQLLRDKVELASDVLKVGHHGSNSSTSSSFLKAVSPKYAVISCGKNNDYGHPHKETTTNLQKANAKVLRTDIDNNIVIISDGKNLSINK